MTLPTLCIFVAIVFERFAWYLFLGELEEWRGPQAVGDLMAMACTLDPRHIATASRLAVAARRQNSAFLS